MDKVATMNVEARADLAVNWALRPSATRIQ